jgi:hypothetical protein
MFGKGAGGAGNSHRYWILVPARSQRHHLPDIRNLLTYSDDGALFAVVPATHVPLSVLSQHILGRIVTHLLNELTGGA